MKKLTFLLSFLFASCLAFTQIGKVGINVTAPLAGLHVVDSSVLFSAAGDVTGPVPGIPINGAGRRLLWYPGKAALRAGYVAGTQWDYPNIGLYSVALGRNTLASGNSSTAVGYGSIANGDFSTCLGPNSSANGYSAIAIGQGTVANNNFSIAMGYQATASGTNSTALGNNVSTNGKNGAFIIGDFTQFASSANDTANQMIMRFGGGYKLYTDPTTTPAITVTSDGNIGLGTNTPAQKLDVNGLINALGGNFAGPLTASYTSDISKTAIYGYANQLINNADYNNTGVTGFGQGNGTGSGINSYGFGIGVKGIGSLNGYGAIGVYAALGSSVPLCNPGSKHYALYADVITPSVNSYAAVFLNGNVGVNISYPSAKLTISAGADDRALLITGGNASDINGLITLAPGRDMTAIDEYLMMKGFNGAVQGSITGNASAGVAYNTTSDSRLKKDIHNTSFGLQQLLRINVKDYRYNNDINKNLQTGFIAQELYKVFPQAVTVGGDDFNEHPWQIDYSKLTPLLVRAIQDLKSDFDMALKQTKDLQNEILDMSAQIKELKKQSFDILTLESRLKQLEVLHQAQQNTH